MPYPVRMSASVSPSQTIAIPFRPATAGLVKAIVVATWIPPTESPSSSPNGGDPPPTEFPMAVTVGLVKPGGTAPVVSGNAGKTVGSDPHKDLGPPTVVTWADTIAEQADLTADWSANVTNTGQVP